MSFMAVGRMAGLLGVRWGSMIPEASYPPGRRGLVLVETGEWLSRQEAAKRAGVHYNTIRKWAEEGLLETKKIPGQGPYEVMIEVGSLDKVIKERHTSRQLTDGDTKERIAALEEEVRGLRTQLAKSETERRELLERVLRLAERD